MASEEQTEQGDDASLASIMGSPGGEDFMTGEGKPAGTRPGALVALLLVAVGAGSYFLYFKQGPAAASAGTTAAAKDSGAGAKKTINEFLAGGSKDLAAMEEMLRDTQQVVRQFLDYPSMTQVPLSELKTNPFRFAPPANEPAAENATNEKRKREELRARAVKAAQDLRIDSLMTGRDGRGGTAIINGRFVKPGEVVDGFTVEEVRQGSVVVREENGFRFELRLNR